MRPIRLTKSEDLLDTNDAYDTRSLDLVDIERGIEAAFMQGWDDAG